MTQEPILVFKFSRPEAFWCSACDEYRGAFDTEGWAIDVIDAFRDHVRRYHAKGEDFSRLTVSVLSKTARN